MPRIRSNEFVNFINTGKNQCYGNLRMVGDTVYSYNMLIAKVDRQNKKILFNGEKKSVTTSVHQSAIRNGFSICLESSGWKIEEM